jgi:hypothetical protein
MLLFKHFYVPLNLMLMPRRSEARQHKVNADHEEEAKGNSAYDLQATKLKGSGGIARCVDGAPAVLTSSNYNSYRPSYGHSAW